MVLFFFKARLADLEGRRAELIEMRMELEEDLVVARTKSKKKKRKKKKKKKKEKKKGRAKKVHEEL